MRGDFAIAAASYDAAAVLAAEVGRRMAERLDYVKIAPQRMADIGCATGDGIRLLMKRYPQSLPLAIDYALPMLQWSATRNTLIQRLRHHIPRAVNADVNALPLAGGTLGLVWSNLMLQWIDDPLPAFREIQRSLDVGGLFMFAMLGPDTLKEIREACLRCDMTPSEIPLRKFHDMHDIGDMLVAAGFADPVMDMEMITLTYRNPRGLLRDQRHLGVRDGLFGAASKRMGWREWRRVFAAWQALYSSDALPASFEIVYGHAWKPQPRSMPDGRAIINIEKLGKK